MGAFACEEILSAVVSARTGAGLSDSDSFPAVKLDYPARGAFLLAWLNPD